MRIKDYHYFGKTEESNYVFRTSCQADIEVTCFPKRKRMGVKWKITQLKFKIKFVECELGLNSLVAVGLHFAISPTSNASFLSSQ